MSVEEKANQLKERQSELMKQISSERSSKNDGSLTQIAKDQAKSVGRVSLRSERTLKGHLAKIYAIDWTADSRRLVSASQDGKMIVWNAFSTFKEAAIPLRTHWVMTCAFAPGGEWVCSGGLDNTLALYNIATKENPTRPERELTGHTGYISCAKFLDDQQVLTASGDMTCIIWDVEKGTPKSRFEGHTGDVMCASLSSDKNLFVSGGCDAVSKVWDIRSNKCIASFSGHQSDVNSIQFFPNNNLFATGSDDASCKLYDLRANQELTTYTNDNIKEPVSSLDFSSTGRLLFVSYDTTKVLVWDTLKGCEVGSFEGHEQKVSSLSVAPDGMALATASWDGHIKIWA
eukprot:gb/GECH01012571.1/.p1 GENE.gb/GECH01012571.1/~~gb/GECH01012571.1/.p1  ORF type:complete len:345 (+),score=79.88 gb/GECH01012571.1/:1-1035(+)